MSVIYQGLVRKRQAERSETMLERSDDYPKGWLKKP